MAYTKSSGSGGSGATPKRRVGKGGGQQAGRTWAKPKPKVVLAKKKKALTAKQILRQDMIAAKKRMQSVRTNALKPPAALGNSSDWALGEQFVDSQYGNLDLALDKLNKKRP